MTTLISHIGKLVNTRETVAPLRGADLARLPSIDEAYLIIEDEYIAGFGKMADLKQKETDFNDHFNASGRLVLPSWCDAHTHLVFAGSREAEFVDKIKGLSYAEIAARGGGILNSARQLNATSEDELFNQ